jgi:putative ABC transport system permease protein
VDIPILVLATRDEFPGFAAGEPFIILDRAGLEAAAPAFDLRPTRRYIRAPVTAAPALSATVQSQSGGTRVISRVELLTDLIEAPLVKAVDDGYRLAVVLATLFAVLAALAAIALTATERTRDFGFLRTLGLSSGQVTALTVVEQLPWALIATASGIGFALGLTWLVEPGLDLGPFTGGEATIGIFVDWGTVLLVAGTVLIAVMVATALYSYRAHRVNLGSVLRIGDHG